MMHRLWFFSLWLGMYDLPRPLIAFNHVITKLDSYIKAMAIVTPTQQVLH